MIENDDVMHVKKALLTIFLQLSFFATFSQSLSLDSCKTLAMRNNVALKNAKIDVAAAVEVKKQTFTKYFPKLSLSAGGYYPAKPLLEFGFEDISNADIREFLQHFYQDYGETLGFSDRITLLENGIILNASLVQPIFLGGRVINGNRLAKIGISVADLQSEMENDKVLMQIEENYWLISSLYEKKRTIETALSFLNTLGEDVNNAVSAGLTTQNDKMKVLVKQNELKSDLLRVENGIKTASYLLCHEIGLDYSEDIVFGDTVSKQKLLSLLNEQNPYDAVNSRKELKLLNYNVEAERLKKKITVGEALPQVVVGAGASYGNPIFEDYSSNALAFAAVRIPLSDWWETSHKLKWQNLQIQKAENLRDDLKEKMIIEIIQSWNNVVEAAEQLKLAEIMAEEAENNLATAQVNYDAGVVSLSELLEAQTFLRQAEDRKTDALINLKIKYEKYNLIAN